MALLPAVIMTINYSHDIATALLAVSGAVMWFLSSNFPASPTAGTDRYFINTYRGVTRMAKDSLIWIIVAGVPRIYYYTEYEWSTAAGDLQVVAIIIKHVIMFLLVGIGIFYWSKLGRKAAQLKLQKGGSAW